MANDKRFRNFALKFERKQEPDEIDNAILLSLRKYPPATVSEMAIAVNRSVGTVHQRMAWLMRNEFVRIADGMRSSQPRSKILSEKGFKYLDALNG